MHSLLHAAIQDRLADAGSFIICDTQVSGFPIRYVSQGFRDLFGFTPEECLGRQCGHVVGIPAIRAADPELEEAAKEHCLMEEVVDKGLYNLELRLTEECRKVISDPDGYVGFTLAVNRDSTGVLFVTELFMLIHKHPSYGWHYFIGFQKDVTDLIPVGHLLDVAADERDELEELLAMREVQNRCEFQVRKAHLEHLDDQLATLWQEWLRQAWLATAPDVGVVATAAKSQPRAPTAKSHFKRPAGHPLAAPAPFARNVPVEDSPPDDSTSFLWGKWCGRLSKMLGGFEQKVEFFTDNATCRLEILGKVVQGQYCVDASQVPMVLEVIWMPYTNLPDWPMQILTSDPVKYSVMRDGSGLHMACPYPTDQHPRQFIGPGYCCLHPVEDEHPICSSNREVSCTETMAVPLATGSCASFITVG